MSQLGKYKTILQMVGLSMMLYRYPLFGLDVFFIGLVLTVVAAVLTLVVHDQLPAGGLAVPDGAGMIYCNRSIVRLTCTGGNLQFRPSLMRE